MPTLQSDHDDWEPPSEFYDLINEKDAKGRRKRKQRDRVELIIAFYSDAHGGNAPTYEQMGDYLGIGRGNAYRFVLELIVAHRAVKKGGKLWLVDSQWTHPVIKQKMPYLLRESVLTEQEIQTLRE